MSILKVARMGHPVLRAKAQPVPAAEIAGPRIQRLIDDMLETMREYSGIGLAAPQVHEGCGCSSPGCATPDARRRIELTGDADMPVIDARSIRRSRWSARPWTRAGRAA